MADLLQDTVVAPVAVPRHRKPDPAPSGPVARFVDNHVSPHIRGAFYGLGIAILTLAVWVKYLDACGPNAAAAFAMEIVAVWIGGEIVGTRLCQRIDAAAPKNSSSSARHRKVT